jgi:hypothetical protein
MLYRSWEGRTVLGNLKSFGTSGVVDERSLVMLFLVVEHMRGIDSAWHPWINLLPQSFNTPLHFGDTQLEELAGTTLHQATK